MILKILIVIKIHQKAIRFLNKKCKTKTFKNSKYEKGPKSDTSQQQQSQTKVESSETASGQEKKSIHNQGI